MCAMSYDVLCAGCRLEVLRHCAVPGAEDLGDVSAHDRVAELRGARARLLAHQGRRGERIVLHGQLTS